MQSLMWLLNKILLKVGSLSTKLARKIHPNPNQRSLTDWHRARGDRTLRLDYSLNKDSLVLDVGGYEGQWASDIYSKYRCKIMIFEPVKTFTDAIKKRFEINPDIIVFPFGLIDKNTEQEISLDDNASSLFTHNKPKEKVKMVCASDFFKEKEVTTIDLMKINIEGSEYCLLENLLENNLIKKIKNIQIQFHNFVPNAEERMKKIQNKLTRTHHLTYQYPFVWENWEINT